MSVVKPIDTGNRRCRLCSDALRHEILDLGMSPPCESFLAADQLDAVEAFYPLRLLVCGSCFLVQLREYVNPHDIFSDYAYFSSYSDSWIAHAHDYCHKMRERFGLGPESRVIELASNDGYLLQHFVSMGVPVLGIEPAANVAKVAIEQGVPTRIDFFGERLARVLLAEGLGADLIAGNNVLAQVPDLNDFVAGIKLILKPSGVVTIEFPHLARTIEGNQFDQIYHEHYSYFSLVSAEKAFARHGLALFDVEELPTHGGSLRLYLRHAENARLPVDPRVDALRRREIEAGYTDIAFYNAFRARAEAAKRGLLRFLIEAKENGKRVAGYGAPGKGNTLLNYCGIRTDFIDFLVDRNPHKHGRFTPGTHIPIYPVAAIDEAKPDYLVILPWNVKDEIMRQMSHVGSWGCKFVIPIPELTVATPRSS
jgi:SAM-dependent methyltransferase